MPVATSKKETSVSIGSQVTKVGFLGGWLIALIHGSVADVELQNDLQMGVPFCSVVIVESIKWGWAYIGPAGTKQIAKRSSLKRKKKEIEKQLMDKSLSSKTKKELIRRKELLALEIVDSHE